MAVGTTQFKKHYLDINAELKAQHLLVAAVSHLSAGHTFKQTEKPQQRFNKARKIKSLWESRGRSVLGFTAELCCAALFLSG